ncbi:hypothetical protein [Hymenobacter sublimis]|uniref:DUF481 domain-containing protein n=1 Tax=Hymenobacter sublimis TaxID=2933777 RepID=A0ABY4JGU5_9BACT|nr:hypothetical protein [Hymenobacter sublimis]UPL50549.1 hypothetical protein MWH26_06480 [Hymenobacter sublimis]
MTKTMSWYNTLLLGLMLSASVPVLGQDFVRIGAGGDFKESRFIQTFSFDFNRTEKVDEKAGRYILYSRSGFYITPSSDVNIGEGVTASENNILVQLYLGKAFFGDKVKSNDGFGVSQLNKAFELNPVVNADKNFDQMLYYGQAKFLLNRISARYTSGPDTFLLADNSFSIGPFFNLGHRRTRVEVNGDQEISGNAYATGGLLGEWKKRIRKKTVKNGVVDDWFLRLSGNYYYVVSDSRNLTGEDFAGIAKASIDKRIGKRIFLGLSYRYGNDNPKYVTVHTLDLGIKVTY